MFHFYAFLSRMKLICCWGLMRNTRFGGNVNPERAALLALFHDATETITGDLPTPVKYYSPQIRSAYREVETVAQGRLLGMLPADLQPCYEPIFTASAEGDRELLPLVKAADKLSAIIKCMEEKGMGNSEFSKAETALRRALADIHVPEADCFAEEFLPSYCLTLDEQE